MVLILGSAGCNGGGGSKTGLLESSPQSGQFRIDSAGELGAGRADVYVNQEIRLGFSAPVDPRTVTSESLKLTEEDTGKTPAGTFALDPDDPRTLVYRPGLAFDSAGNPHFGLAADKAYLLEVKGTASDPLGPYIRSSSGQPNETRLRCRLVASKGVLDAQPGRPSAAITVDTVTACDPSGSLVEFAPGVPAPGAMNVCRASPVKILFDEVMNPTTLADPVTGQSSFIRAFVDADGDTADRSDGVAIDGTFTVTIDHKAGNSTVVFQPTGAWPSAGRNPLDPRQVVVELSPRISDLSGNPLSNAGPLAFASEPVSFDPIVFEETFDEPALLDAVRTGVAWGNGLLGTGIGGGSGRLGHLVVPTNTVVVLDTDWEDFSSIANPKVFDPRDVIDRPHPLVITDGVFEFAYLRVEAGGVLRFRGNNPARLYVRGVADIQGFIDVSATNGTLHRSDELLGGSGGHAGPGGGGGGRGGSRADGAAFSGTFSGLPIGGVANPGVGPSDVTDPATYGFVNGADGGGIPFPSTLSPQTSVCGGQSGLGWPQPTAARPDLHMPQDVSDVAGLEVDRFLECRYPAPAAPGGGGANALDGGQGHATFSLLSPLFPPPDALGGNSGDLQIDALVRSLSPELGLLRGGGGGGGGGGHIQRTQLNGSFLFDCMLPQSTGSQLQIVRYRAHSSAGGGGGGGALQVAAGNVILLGGRIDASGGVGGGGIFPPSPETPEDLAQGGGGGAGGSILLQSDRIKIKAASGRLDVSGGAGGEGSGSAFPATPSRGGHGSPGFVRIESTVPSLIQDQEGKLDPTEAELQELYGPSVTSADILSTGPWTPPIESPSGWSGAQSSWIRPSGDHFRLVFEEDGATLGWDMRLRIAGVTPQSFRGQNDLFPGMTLEEVFGTQFGAAPVIVRFQGARALGANAPRAVPQIDAPLPLVGKSITEWVSNPADLNDFHGDETLAPNVFRFAVLWDRSQVEFPGIEGLEDLLIRIQPE